MEEESSLNLAALADEIGRVPLLFFLPSLCSWLFLYQFLWSLLRIANVAIAEEERRLQQEQSKLWRSRFKGASTDALRAGSRALKVTEAPDPEVTSESMTRDWEPIWTRKACEATHAWSEVCRAAVWPPAEPNTQDFSFPTPNQLAAAIRKGSGGAGFDGWTASELKGLAGYCPWLVEELADLLKSCIQASDEAVVASCQDRFFSWRVVGIPKRCEAAVRPIAISSAVVRAWNRALLAQFSPPPPGQFCGAQGLSGFRPPSPGFKLPASAVRSSISARLSTALLMRLHTLQGRRPGSSALSSTTCGAWSGAPPATALSTVKPLCFPCVPLAGSRPGIHAALVFCHSGPGLSSSGGFQGLMPSSTWMIGA